MRSRRSLTLLIGLLVSIIVTVALSIAFEAPILLLILPFIPILGWGRRREQEVKTCPSCEYQTTEEEVRYCPRDGTLLETER